MNSDAVALAYAEKLDQPGMHRFYPSLYLNLGKSHELLGNLAEAPAELYGEHVHVSITESRVRMG